MSDFEREQIHRAAIEQLRRERAEQQRSEFDRQWTVASCFKRVEPREDKAA